MPAAPTYPHMQMLCDLWCNGIWYPDCLRIIEIVTGNPQPKGLEYGDLVGKLDDYIEETKSHGYDRPFPLYDELFNHLTNGR